MSDCTQRCLDGPCSLDAEHVLRGEHHFSLSGLVEWPCYSDDPTGPVRCSGKRSELATSLLGVAPAPGGQLA